MIATKEICALLLAGGMGAGSVVGVQHVKPAITKAKAVHRPARVHRAPARVAARPAPAPAIPINDCPTVAAPLGPSIADLAPLPPYESTPMGGAPEYAGIFIPASGGYWPGWNHGGGGGIPGGGIPGGPGDSGETGGGVPDDGGSTPDGGVVPGVPQPASWVMMIAGFGLVGMALRRNSPEVASPAAEQPRRV